MILALLAASASAQELTDPPLHPYNGEPLLRSDGAFLVYLAQAKVRNILDPDGDETRPLRNAEARDSGLAVALARAWKRDVITDGIAATKTMLIACQRETSVVLTTALMRSDPQQAHCFRF
ncbi:MAG: hypothetical protein K2P77_11055 [Burkholderiaceae bacterium]|nr:hypothetical protein [Burkholderiaceae bacterium]